VVNEFSALLKAYGVGTVRGDRYGGLWPRERFAVHSVEYRTADKPKSDLYRDLLPTLNSGRVELPDHPRLHGAAYLPATSIHTGSLPMCSYSMP
jgi:hypothetical protein